LASIESWPPSPSSLVELVGQLADEARALVSEIVNLAAAELHVRVSELRGLFVLLAGALVALLVGLLAAVTAAVAALALAMPLWAAALVVAVAVLAIAGALAGAAVARLRKIAKPPEETLAVLKEGTAWLRGAR
jgi:ribose/xylose/arabinose/galactoside ABC-type transport system permease subunit